jgi:hypothetical protein
MNLTQDAVEYRSEGLPPAGPQGELP